MNLIRFEMDSKNVSNRITIGIDMDEVLCPVISNLVDFFNLHYSGKMNKDLQSCFEKCHISQFKRNVDFETIWGCSYELAFEILDYFFKSDFFKKIQPIQDSIEVVKNLAETYRLVIITNRHTSLHDDILIFLNKYYGDAFSEIHTGNEYGMNGEKISKEEMCRRSNVSLLIDDSPKNILRVVKENGISGIVFGKYPWNEVYENEFQGFNVFQVENWKEIQNTVQIALTNFKQKNNIGKY